jgi:hypothetical protein
VIDRGNLGMLASSGLGNIEPDAAVEAALLLRLVKGGLAVGVGLRELQLLRHQLRSVSYWDLEEMTPSTGAA